MTDDVVMNEVEVESMSPDREPQDLLRGETVTDAAEETTVSRQTSTAGSRRTGSSAATTIASDTAPVGPQNRSFGPWCGAVADTLQEALKESSDPQPALQFLQRQELFTLSEVPAGKEEGERDAESLAPHAGGGPRPGGGTELEGSRLLRRKLRELAAMREDGLRGTIGYDSERDRSMKMYPFCVTLPEEDGDESTQEEACEFLASVIRDGGSSGGRQSVLARLDSHRSRLILAT